MPVERRMYRNNYWQIPLHEACFNGHYAVAHLLLSTRFLVPVEGIKLNCSEWIRKQRLHENQFPLMHLEWQQAQLRAFNHERYLPVHLAAAFDSHTIVALLLRYDCHSFPSGDLDGSSSSRNLMPREGTGSCRMGVLPEGERWAAVDGSMSPTLHAINGDMHTALHLAAIYNAPLSAAVLIVFGANVLARDAVQWTPLHIAALKSHLALVRTIISESVSRQFTESSDSAPMLAYLNSVINARNKVRVCGRDILYMFIVTLLCVCSLERRHCIPPACMTS
jgi:ankyrin repeat protein